MVTEDSVVDGEERLLAREDNRKGGKVSLQPGGESSLWVILIHILHLGLIAKLPAVGFMAAMYLQRALLFFVEVVKDSLCVVDILQGEFAPAIPVAVIQVLPDDRVGASRAIGVDLDTRGGP